MHSFMYKTRSSLHSLKACCLACFFIALISVSLWLKILYARSSSDLSLTAKLALWVYLISSLVCIAIFLLTSSGLSSLSSSLEMSLSLIRSSSFIDSTAESRFWIRSACFPHSATLESKEARLAWFAYSCKPSGFRLALLALLLEWASILRRLRLFCDI